MKLLLFIVLLLFAPSSLIFSQSDTTIIDGSWSGFIELQGEPLTISLLFNTMYDETDGTINIPQQSSFSMPVEVALKTADSLIFSFETGSGPGVFNASLNNNSPMQISGLYQLAGINYPFTITKEDLTETSSFNDRHSEQEHIIDAGTHSIAGSLVIPDSINDSTLIILVNGSGSQTRNNPVAGFEVFRELALQLANNGYFSFRYDDRGTGGSSGTIDATLQELAEDVSQIATYFTDDVNTTRFNTVVFLGHSQGGVVSLIAAEESSPRQLILLASPTLPGDEVITQQIRYLSQTQDIPDEIVQENLEFQQKVYEAARTGTGWEELEQDIANRLREQIEELPEAQQRTLGDMDQFIWAQVNRQLEDAKTDWFRSFIDTDPRFIISEIQIPILALYGENDTQVLPEENRDAIEQIQNNITTVTISQANHLFQTSDTGMPHEYAMLEQEFADEVISEILRFLGEF